MSRKISVSSSWSVEERKSLQNLIFVDLMRETVDNKTRLCLVDLCMSLNTDTCAELENNRDDYADYLVEVAPQELS